jgi:fucose permease
MGLYILTFGLAFLETAANPYALAMGAKETATQRLNLAQAFNPCWFNSWAFCCATICVEKTSI